ncbi:MAG: S16 family serine protease [Acidimicrobiia bacterium]
MKRTSPLSAPPPEQALPGLGAPTSPTAVGPPGSDEPTGGRTRKWRRWMTWGLVVAGILAFVIILGSAIRLPYYSVSPGSALDMTQRVGIEGAPQYEPDGEIMLLFIRQRARVNVWEWLRASFDPDIDLHKEQEFVGDQSPEDVRTQSDADMAASQIAAKRIALEAAGYEVPLADGQVVLAVAPSRPANDVLAPGDVLLAADGQELVEPGDLGEIVRAHAPGETVDITLLREGVEQTVAVGTEAADDGSTIMGIRTAGNYAFPVEIELDTSSIGGPSAGLAMTLSIIDQLTPGNLTGGRDVAVTGTIEEDGHVGEIGGISQKAVAARAAGADLFLVPKCTTAEFKAQCEDEVERAIKRAGSLLVVPVATVDEALAALEAAGGDPVDVAPHAAA